MALTALVLSQDQKALEVLRRILADLGIEANVCTNPEAARHALTTAKFEAIIIDLDDTPGAKALMSSLRKLPSVRNSIIFAITVLTEVKVAFQLGANFVLDKPLAVERTLRSFRAAQGLIARERRRYYRHHVSFPAIVEVGGKSNMATVTNLSEGGMAVDTREALVAGMMIKWSFDLPETEEHVEGKGEIAWVNGRGNAGIRFVYIPAKFKTSLELWMNARTHTDEPTPLVVNANRIWRAEPE